jgi:hypothetical protein
MRAFHAHGSPRPPPDPPPRNLDWKSAAPENGGRLDVELVGEGLWAQGAV